MEVAAGKGLVSFCDDQRIVGDAVGLEPQGGGRLAQDVERGAHDLRLAAQAVGILHPLVAHDVGGANGRTGHQGSQRLGGLNLTRLPAKGMDAGVERRVRSFGGLGGEGAGDQSRLEQDLRLEQCGQGVGGGELCAVEQRQSLFWPEVQGLQSGSRQDFTGR